MTIGEIKQAIEASGFSDDTETDVVEVLVRRGEYYRLRFYNMDNQQSEICGEASEDDFS